MQPLAHSLELEKVSDAEVHGDIGQLGMKKNLSVTFCSADAEPETPLLIYF